MLRKANLFALVVFELLAVGQIFYFSALAIKLLLGLGLLFIPVYNIWARASISL